MSVAERRQREREERSNGILDAAEAIFYKKGLDAATMEDVAEQAHLGKGTLYLYFRSKDELLMGLVARRQRRLIARFETATASDGRGIAVIREMLLAYAEHMTTPIEHLKMAIGRWVGGTRIEANDPCAACVASNVQQLFGLMCGAIERGQRDGSVRRDIEPAQLALLLWSSVNGSLLLTLQLTCMPEPQHLGPHALAREAAIDLLLDAARPRQEQQA